MILWCWAGGFLIIAKALGMAAVKAMVCITGIIFTGRMLLRPLMRRIAALQNADIFAATTLLVILGCSALTQMSGHSRINNTGCFPWWLADGRDRIHSTGKIMLSAHFPVQWSFYVLGNLTKSW